MNKRHCLAITALFVSTIVMSTFGQSNPYDDIGHLNTRARQAQFWLDATGTAYMHGACGFILQPSPVNGGLLDVVASIAHSDGSAPQVWVVGTFQLAVQLPLEEPNPPALMVENTEVGVMLFQDDPVRNVISGYVSFNTGMNTDLTAVSFTSGTTEVITDLYWEGDNIFVPIRTHQSASAAAIDAEVTSLAYTGLSVPPPDKDLSIEQSAIINGDGVSGGGNSGGCLYIWCHRPASFCLDIAECVTDRNQQLADARADRAACLAASQVAYILCMVNLGCWDIVLDDISGGIGCAIADFTCTGATGLADAACRAIYLGKVTAAEWNFQACGANAKKNNGRVYRDTCNCPAGWIPFPTQAPPSWGAVNCSGVFGVWGLTWSYDLIFN